MPVPIGKIAEKGKINRDLSPGLSSSAEEAKLDPGLCKGLPLISRSCMGCAGTSFPRGAAAAQCYRTWPVTQTEGK